jgi:hypothetical protein
MKHFVGSDKMTKKKFVLQEVWLLNENGNKIMKFDKSCYLGSPMDGKEIVDENGVAVVRPKKIEKP